MALHLAFKEIWRNKGRYLIEAFANNGIITQVREPVPNTVETFTPWPGVLIPVGD